MSRENSPDTFQFHKGTIKPSSRQATLKFHHHFNSIKVRLNLSNNSIVTNMSTFQFHKGTIKPWEQQPSADFDAIFQFHKGTIKPYFF